MAIPKEPETDQVESIGDIEEMETSIRKEDLPFAYNAFLQYKDPIGSTVREITSNAVDAHDRAGNNDPVIVRIDRSDTIAGEKATFQVIDFGTGMSYEKIRKVYLKLFNSDKRDTNDEMGMFGLGSKSPLAYADSFVLETYRRGIEPMEQAFPSAPRTLPTEFDKFGFLDTETHSEDRQICVHRDSEALFVTQSYYWTYTVYRRQGDSPGVSKIAEGQSDRDSGTVVKVPIDDYSDLHDFKQKIKKQLAYFHNIRFENCGLSEDSTLYEGENFIYKENNSFQKLHVCYGNVYYELDFNAANLPETEGGPSYKDYMGYEVDFALKFDIGEIDVIWNRESLEYTDRTKEAIQKKLQDTKEELSQIRDNLCSDIDSFEDWYEAKNTTSNKRLPLPVDDEDISVRIKKPFIDGDIVEYKPYSDILPKLPHPSSFYMFKIHRGVEKGYIDKRKGPALNKMINDNNDNNLLLADEKYRTKKNKYIYEKEGLRYFYIVRRDSQPDVADRAKYKCGFSVDDDLSLVELRAIQNFEEEIVDFVEDELDSYDDITVPDDYNPDVKKTKSSGKVSKDDTIPLKYLTSSPNRGEKYKWSRKRVKLGRLRRSATYIYGFRKHDDKLKSLYYLWNGIRRFDDKLVPRSYGRSRKEGRLCILKIAMKRESIFQEFPNAFHVDEWLNLDHRLHRRHATAVAINNSSAVGILNGVDRNLKDIEICEKATQMAKYLRKLKNRNYIKGIKDNREKEILEKFDPNPEIVKQINYVEGFHRLYPLLPFICENTKCDEKILKEVRFYMNSKPNIHPLLYYKYTESKDEQN